MNIRSIFSILDIISQQSTSSTCVRCDANSVSNNVDDTCLNCQDIESYVSKFEGTYPDKIIDCLIRVNISKKQIATLILNEEDDVELDGMMLFEIEIKTKVVVS